MDTSFLHEKYERDVRGSRTKLFLMLAILGGIVVAMIALSRPSGPAVSEGERPALDQGGAAQKLGPNEGIDYAQWGAPAPELAVTDEAMKSQFAFLNDPKSLDELMDRTTEIEPIPFFYLLHRVWKERCEDAKAEAAADVSWATLWDEGATFRTKALRVSGTIARIWEQPLQDNPMGLKCVYGYRVRADRARPDGHDQLFDVYAIEKLVGALRYDHVVTFGRFLKAQTVEPDSKHLDDPELHVAVVLTRRFEPLTYLADPEPPAPVTDGNRPEARAFNWLLRRARDIPFAELRKEANDKATFVDLTANTDRFRWKPVAIRGELRRLIRLKLGENPLGVAEVYYGQIVDPDRKMVTFYCLHIPDNVQLREGVYLVGYFMKIWKYWSKGGEEFGSEEIASPVIVAQRMLRVVVPKDHTLEILVILIGGATVGVLLIAQARDRAARLRAEEARRQRLFARAPKNLNEIGRRLAGGPDQPAPRPPAEDRPEGKDTPGA